VETNAKMLIPNGRTPFTISDWNGVRFPAAREAQTECKAEIEDGVQELFSEALFTKWSFSRNAGESAEYIFIWIF